MKKLLACLFLLTSVVGFSEEKISIENIEVRQEKLFIKGEETPITGTLEKKYPSGKIEATLEVVDGKLNGKTYIYYETGIVKRRKLCKQSYGRGSKNLLSKWKNWIWGN